MVFVERDQNATRTLQHNVRAFSETFGTSQAPSMEVVKSTAASFLKVSPVSGDELKKFDLVFLDPPYDLDDAELSENLTLVAHHLSDDAVVVVERSSRSPEPSWPETLRSVKSRRYGETTIWLATQSGVTPFAE